MASGQLVKRRPKLWQSFSTCLLNCLYSHRVMLNYLSSAQSRRDATSIDPESKKSFISSVGAKCCAGQLGWDISPLRSWRLHYVTLAIDIRLLRSVAFKSLRSALSSPVAAPLHCDHLIP